jgi:hypothetical protein
VTVAGMDSPAFVDVLDTHTVTFQSFDVAE